MALGTVLWFVSQPLVVVVSLLFVLHLAFFRDPKRKIPEGGQPVSPADGKVVEISSVPEGKFLQEEAVKIGIFLSVFVVHVNRAPTEGIVRYLHYEPGKFLNALCKESVHQNESNWIGIDQGGKKLLIRQISGTIARRIFWDVALGGRVARGGKIGIICYGSRTECYLPKRFFKATVQIGDHVKAGESILGEWLS